MTRDPPGYYPTGTGDGVHVGSDLGGRRGFEQSQGECVGYSIALVQAVPLFGSRLRLPKLKRPPARGEHPYDSSGTPGAPAPVATRNAGRRRKLIRSSIGI